MKTKIWIIKIGIIAFLLSAGFTLISEIFITDLPMAAAIFIVLIFIAIGVIFDIIGVAFATCDEVPILAMGSRGDKNSKYALPLVKKSEIVSNICNDVIGDVCGIISGSAGAAITLKVVFITGSESDLIPSVIITAIISVITIVGKASCKKLAMKNNTKIVMTVGGILKFFSFGKKNEKKS